MDTFLTHLAEKRGKLQKQLQKLQGEIADLDKAERLYRESGALSKGPIGPPPKPVFVVHPPPPPPEKTWGTLPPPPRPVFSSPLTHTLLTVPPGAGKTIKERVLQLLEKNQAGLTSSQILNNLNIDGGQPVSRESLSPQLSRLRTSDQKIDLKDGVWSLQKHVNPTGPGGVYD